MTIETARAKTRRPYGMLADKPGKVHPAGETGDYATFEYREDALDAIDRLNASDRFGWDARPSFSGAWDLWIVPARRRSRGYGNMALRTDGKVR